MTVRTLDELIHWLARAYDLGHFAIEAKANSIDPMQAEMVGIALALAPNDACYIPLAHKQSGDGSGLFAAGLAPDQIKAADAIEALRPLLESAGILKVGFNIKFNAVMLAQHGVTLRNHDDAQLMSYALDAGRNSHSLEALAESRLGHAIISHGELTGSGKAKLTFDQVAIDRATAYSAEDADVILRLWSVLKPRLVAELFIQQPDAPRSIFHNLHQIKNSLRAIRQDVHEHGDDPTTATVADTLQFIVSVPLARHFGDDPGMLGTEGRKLSDTLADLLDRLYAVHPVLSDHYFSHQARITPSEAQAELKL